MIGERRMVKNLVENGHIGKGVDVGEVEVAKEVGLASGSKYVEGKDSQDGENEEDEGRSEN